MVDRCTPVCVLAEETHDLVFFSVTRPCLPLRLCSGATMTADLGLSYSAIDPFDFLCSDALQLAMEVDLPLQVRLTFVSSSCCL